MWKGVLIKESLNNSSILSSINVVNTRTTRLEGEEERGSFTFYSVEIADDAYDTVVNFISEHITLKMLGIFIW